MGERGVPCAAQSDARRERAAQLLLIAVALAVMHAFGCAPSLPTYPRMDAREALAVMAERDAGIRTVSARCRIIASAGPWRSVQFEGAVAAQPPDHLRICAWKASQPVFDMTVRPDGTWMYAAREDAGQRIIPGNTGRSGGMARAWSMMSGGFAEDEWQVQAGLRRLRLTRQWDSGVRVQCAVDRRTLTLRQCVVAAPGGKDRLRLKLDRYRSVGSHVWPTRWRLVSPRGTFTVLLDDPQINTELPERAFEPPARAVKQP